MFVPFFKKKKTDIVPSREVPLYILNKRLEFAKTTDEAKQIQNDIDKLLRVSTIHKVI